MSTIFLNGRFLPAHEAQVAALDAGLQHGVGLFETLLGGVAPSTTPRAGDDDLTGAWACHLTEHIDRLAASARELHLSANIDTGVLHEAVLATIARAGLPRARVRITLTAGPINLLSEARKERDAAAPAPSGTVMIAATPATPMPARSLTEGALVGIADAKANPLNPTESHKTLNYWWRLRELGSWAARGASEALVFSVTNHLVGGCVSSAIIIKDGEAHAPIVRGEERLTAAANPGAGASVLPSPALPGVTRAWAIDELAGEGVITRKRMLTIDDVLSADEVLLTNSTWGVLPVTRIESHAVNGAKPGEIGEMLAGRWTRHLAMLAGEPVA